MNKLKTFISASMILLLLGCTTTNHLVKKSKDGEFFEHNFPKTWKSKYHERAPYSDFGDGVDFEFDQISPPNEKVRGSGGTFSQVHGTNFKDKKEKSDKYIDEYLIRILEVAKVAQRSDTYSVLERGFIKGDGSHKYFYVVYVITKPENLTAPVVNIKYMIQGKKSIGRVSRNFPGLEKLPMKNPVAFIRKHMKICVEQPQETCFD